MFSRGPPGCAGNETCQISKNQGHRHTFFAIDVHDAEFWNHHHTRGLRKQSCESHLLCAGAGLAVALVSAILCVTGNRRHL